MPLPEKILSGLEQLARTRSESLRARPTEGMKALDARRVEAQRSPFEMAGTSKLKPLEVIDNPLSGMPRGRALDLNALGDWDLAHFQPLERKRPTTVSKRAQLAYSPENVRDFERYVRRGATEGGLEWYDMSPLSRVALQEMSSEDFKRLMAMNAGASARSGVSDQIKRASLAWYYHKQGIPWPMTNSKLAEVADPGYGHLAHDIHSKHLGPLVAGEEPGFSSIDQPKYASYFNNFMGNMAPLTADTHYQALHGFPMKESYNKYNKKWIEAPDFSKDIDYPFAENFSGERARRMGMPLPLYQAAAWVGGKDATGVRDARPFAAVYDDLIGRTADQMDLTPTEAMKKHFRGEIPLMPIEKAGGGKVGGLEALQQYIRYRLPKKYATREMRPLRDESETGVDDFKGSSRELFSLGDDRLVKLAKRPRGLHEMSLEGDPRVARHLPELDWRSPDNELAIVRRLPHTPEASANLFEGMKDRYENANMRTPIPSYRIHRDDPQLSRMMSKHGLDDFKPLDIHGPDFFMAPEHHWSTALGHPTLLDPGALDYRITRPQFEQELAPRFRDISDERLRAMGHSVTTRDAIENAMMHGDIRSLDELGIGRGTEDFLGPAALWPPGDQFSNGNMTQAMRRLLPNMPGARSAGQTFPTYEDPGIQPPRMVTGNADGGLIETKLRALKNKLAGGGVPRNWLRGVKGSAIDKVMEEMKDKVLPRHLRRDIRADPDKDLPDYGLDRMQEEARPRLRAQLQWVEKNLGNYIVREMGAPNDPLDTLLAGQTKLAVKKLAPHEVPNYIVPPPPERLMPGYGRGTRAQKDLEDKTKKEQWQQQRSEFIDNAPGWLRKHIDEDALRAEHKPHLLPSTHLYDIDHGGWGSYMAGPMNDMMDWMRQSDIPPDRLGRVSVPQALKASQDWHAQLAKKAEEAKNAPLAIGPWLKEHKAYPTGFKWYQYDPTNKPMTEIPGYSIKPTGRGDFAIHKGDKEVEPVEHEGFTNRFGDYSDAHEIAHNLALGDALSAEGEHMGHCVGDYCDSVTGGDTKIFSLRDEKGRPHVTVEVQSGEHKRSQAGYNRLPQNVKDEYEEHFKSTGKHSMDFGRDFPEWAKANHPELVDNPSQNIVQIKGKGNAKPKDDYLPYVQDFVRSGQWGNVGDLANTGLRRIDSGQGGTGGSKYMTTEEAAPFARHKWERPNQGQPNPEWLTEDEYIKRRLETDSGGSAQWAQMGESGIRKFLRDKAQYDPRGSHYFDVPDDWKPQGYAKGGAVQPMSVPREAPDERLMRAELQLEILHEELQQPDNTPQDAQSIKREIQHVEQVIAQLEAAGARGGKGVKTDLALDGRTSPSAPLNSAPDGESEDPLLDQALERMLSGDVDDDFLGELMGAVS